jgi:hypothetical protein
VEESLKCLIEIRERDTDWHKDTMWYRAAYVGAAARLRWVETKKPPQEEREKELRLALRGAIEAMWDVEKLLSTIRGRRPPGRKLRDLREFLLKTEAGNAALLASLLFENGIDAKNEEPPKSRKELASQLGNCFNSWPEVGDCSDPGPVPSECRALSHTKLVRFIETPVSDGDVIMNGRGRFNLACYYSRLGNSKQSLKELGRALDLRPDILDAANDDPGLHKVRSSEPKLFGDLLSRHDFSKPSTNGRPPASSLELPRIGRIRRQRSADVTQSFV